MPASIVTSMAMTSMQIDGKVRDELAAVAASDFGGVPLGEAVRRLLREHKIRRVMERYAELRADPDEWASYQAEARLTDQVAGEGLPGATDEYPELNR
jgi:phage protein D